MRKKRSIKLSIVLCIFVLVGNILGGCGTENATNKTEEKGLQSAEDGGTFYFGLEDDVTSLDPAYSYNFSTTPTIAQMIECLFTFDNTTSEVIPALAESLDLSEDEMTYTIHLREGVHFWDGSEMTSEDVVFCMERIKDPDTASFTCFMYDDVDTIEAVDTYTVEVKLVTPNCLFKYSLATHAAAIYSKAFYEEEPDTFGTAERGIMGTGPYIYEDWISGQEVSMTKNEDYWDTEHQPSFDKVVFQIIPESTTRLASMETGELSATFQMPSSQYNAVGELENVDMKFVEAFATHCIYFNCQKAPFDDVNVRKALNYCFDQESYYQAYIGEAGEKGSIFYLPETLEMFNDKAWENLKSTAPSYDYDLEKAKECLAESAYSDGFEATIVVASNDMEGINAALMLQEAAGEIGITINIEKQPYAEAVACAFSGDRDYEMVIFRWDTDYPDPALDLSACFYSSNVGDGGSNISNWRNEKYDGLVSESMKISDDSQRAQVLADAYQLIAEDAPFICFAHEYQVRIAQDNIGGVPDAPMYLWTPFIKYMYFKE